MGKNLKTADLVMRTGKLAFYQVPGDVEFTRMEGFTSLSTSKSPKEYSRQYVDEDFERSDITGYATSVAYALDRYDGNKVIDDIISIHEDEKIGQAAVRTIVQVDMTTAEHIGGSMWTATAKMRDYTVIPDADGDTTDCMTYSGNFKTRGEMEEVSVTTSDDFQTIVVAGSTVSTKLKSITFQAGNATPMLAPTFSGDVTEYSVTASGTVYLIATAESDACEINVLHNGTTLNANKKSVTLSNVSSGNTIFVTVSYRGTEASKPTTYTIHVN